MRRAARKQVQYIEFRVQEPGEVVAQMQRMGQEHDGWVNMRPDIPPEQAPPSGGLGALFAVSVHEVPVCTWVPGQLQRNGVDPDSLGIQHAAGTRTAFTLRSLGTPVPDGWRVTQDHPRRGLVVKPPVATDPADELTWLLQAATLLSRVPLTGAWVAEVHSPR
jgi:hypothetical protein